MIRLDRAGEHWEITSAEPAYSIIPHNGNDLTAYIASKLYYRNTV